MGKHEKAGRKLVKHLGVLGEMLERRLSLEPGTFKKMVKAEIKQATKEAEAKVEKPSHRKTFAVGVSPDSPPQTIARASSGGFVSSKHPNQDVVRGATESFTTCKEEQSKGLN